MRLGHVCLSTPRLDRMVAFYTDELGCEVAHEFLGDGGRRYGVFLAVGEGTFLELFHDDLDRGDEARFRHFAFQVDDVRAIARRFRSLGQEPEVFRGRTDRALQCWVRDPDGNTVEFHEYDEESVQFAHLPASERGCGREPQEVRR